MSEEDRDRWVDDEAAHVREWLDTLYLLEQRIPLRDMRGLVNPTPPELRERAS